MKNLTIALDDESYRNARIRAAEQGTSVSAMVKRFLTEGGERPAGVRDMPISLSHPSAADDLPPGAYGRFADGTPYYTKDGKPRQPGAARGLLGWTEDAEEWPEGFLDAANLEDTPAARIWWMTAEQEAEYLAKQEKI